MDISFKGCNCIEISTKKATTVFDNRLSKHSSLKDYKANDDSIIVLETFEGLAIAGKGAFLVAGPGEYEIKDLSIKAIPAKQHSALDDSKKSTIYKLSNPDCSVVVVGHIAAPLSEDQLGQIGVVDIAIIPVGGNGYTLDSHEATKLVKQLSPKIVVPTHYEDKAIEYEVPQAAFEVFAKELGVEVQAVPKLRVKPAELTDSLKIVKIER